MTVYGKGVVKLFILFTLANHDGYVFGGRGREFLPNHASALIAIRPQSGPTASTCYLALVLALLIPSSKTS